MKKHLMLRKGGAKFGLRHRELQPGKRERRYQRNLERDLRSPQPLPVLSLPLIFSNVARRPSTAKRQIDRLPALDLSSNAVVPRVVVREVDRVSSSNLRKHKGNAMINRETMQRVGAFGVGGTIAGYLTLRALGLNDDVGVLVQGLMSKANHESWRGIPVGYFALAAGVVSVASFVSPKLTQTFFGQIFGQILNLAAFGTRGVAVVCQSAGACLDVIGLKCGSVAGYIANNQMSRYTLRTNSLTWRPLIARARDAERSNEEKWARQAKQNEEDRDIGEVNRGVLLRGFQYALGHVAFASVLFVGAWLGYNAKTGAQLPETIAKVYNGAFHSKTEVAAEKADKNDESAAGQAAQKADADKALETANVDSTVAPKSGGAS